ncbi:MAG: aryl-alcohol dehydrogenase-like predicted oxidoreductase [Ilumatobacter sp.]
MISIWGDGRAQSEMEIVLLAGSVVLVSVSDGGSRVMVWQRNAMKYVPFGNTGLSVSAVTLGCMSYGESGKGTHAWSMDETSSRPFIEQALEAGINCFDTANVYSLGSSEEIVGRALGDMTNREDVIIATKVRGRMREGRFGEGLSRKAIMHEVDQSLKRLGTDYIDLYQIHRWDHHTPIEETMEALHDLIRSGKVHHIGASSMYAWQFSKAQYTADANGWTRFVSMQPHYNLINREEEREMLPLCRDMNVAVIPWSPMARGKLTREWGATTNRTESDDFGRYLYSMEESDQAVAGAVGVVAEARGVSRAQIALAWVMRNKAVTSPIIGATKPHHIDDAVAAVELELTDDEAQLLEEHYLPHPIVGFS